MQGDTFGHSARQVVAIVMVENEDGSSATLHIFFQMSRKFPSFIVDAFTTKSFAGNPAAVCLIPEVISNNLDHSIWFVFN